MNMLLELPPLWMDSSIYIGIISAAILVYFLYPTQPQLPLINAKKPFEIFATNARKRYLADAETFLQSGLKQANVFRINTERGIKTVLSPKYANEIRNIPALSFADFIYDQQQGHLPGFEPFQVLANGHSLVQNTIRLKFDKTFGRLIQPVSDEAAYTLRTAWTDDPNWHTFNLISHTKQLVSHLVYKVMLGDELCRNKDWIQLNVDYVPHNVLAAITLGRLPSFTRRIVARYHPLCLQVREDMQKARDILQPVLDARREAKETARRRGQPVPRYEDSIEWMEECAKGEEYDPAAAQFVLSILAVTTTADLLTTTMQRLCGREELVGDLRREIIDTVGKDGLNKATLSQLKLMDSTLKEALRLKPNNIFTMQRLATDNITLSDGTHIPKGSLTVIPNYRMWDEAVYPNADQFDAYRFLRMRDDPGREVSSQLVTPSAEHMGFGFGKQACPGRFFAAHILKIALCHILMKYDFKAEEGYTFRTKKIGQILLPDDEMDIVVRRREEEISL